MSLPRHCQTIALLLQSCSALQKLEKKNGIADSWAALATAICVAELDAPSDAAPATAAEGCPNRAMSALAARLAASVDFRRRLFHLASTAQLPEETLGARLGM